MRMVHSRQKLGHFALWTRSAMKTLLCRAEERILLSHKWMSCWRECFHCLLSVAKPPGTFPKLRGQSLGLFLCGPICDDLKACCHLSLSWRIPTKVLLGTQAALLRSDHSWSRWFPFSFPTEMRYAVVSTLPSYAHFATYCIEHWTKVVRLKPTCTQLRAHWDYKQATSVQHVECARSSETTGDGNQEGKRVAMMRTVITESFLGSVCVVIGKLELQSNFFALPLYETNRLRGTCSVLYEFPFIEIPLYDRSLAALNLQVGFVVITEALYVKLQFSRLSWTLQILCVSFSYAGGSL